MGDARELAGLDGVVRPGLLDRDRLADVAVAGLARGCRTPYLDQMCSAETTSCRPMRRTALSIAVESETAVQAPTAPWSLTGPSSPSARWSTAAGSGPDGQEVEADEGDVLDGAA